MRLKRICIANFRATRFTEVDLTRHTAILGGNGAGKSTILRAIEKFYSASPRVDIDDFFGRDTSSPIEISLTFEGFNSDERERFGERIRTEEMTVTRVFEYGSGRNSGRYFGSTAQHPPFAEIRALTAARDKSARFNQLISQNPGLYSGLTNARAAADAETQMASWEQNNPTQCDLMRDDGQFFGFTNVGRGNLERSTKFVFIGAVRDATSDAADAKGAVIEQLWELVVRSAIQQRDDVREFQARVSEEYRNVVDPSNIAELQTLGTDLSDTLSKFYANTAVNLRWLPANDFEIPLPKADVLLDDDGFVGPVDRKGHGLQRAFIVSLLQQLAKATTASEAAVQASAAGATSTEATDGSANTQPISLPGLILAIEEPELYQHPTKQRHFASVLKKLSDGSLSGVATETQVLFASHSSLFVSIDSFDEIRIARRVAGPTPDAPKECAIKAGSLEQVCELLIDAFQAEAGTFTTDGLKQRLHVLNAQLAEGFFAEMVVLVEGPIDRAAMHSAAELADFDLQHMNIAVLEVTGKSNLCKIAAIFTHLEIPTFAIWDCDRDDNAKAKKKAETIRHNKAIQRFLGIPEDKMFEFCTVVGEDYACFETTLEPIVRAELGHAEFDAALEQATEKYGMGAVKDPLKSPAVMRDVLMAMYAAGRRSPVIDEIIEAIRKHYQSAVRGEPAVAKANLPAAAVTAS